MEQVDRVKAEQIRQHVQLTYGIFRKELLDAVERGAYVFNDGTPSGDKELSVKDMNLTFSDTPRGMVLRLEIPLPYDCNHCPAVTSWRKQNMEKRLAHLYEDMLKLRNRWIDHFGRDAKLNLKALVDPSLLDGLPF